MFVSWFVNSWMWLYDEKRTSWLCIRPQRRSMCFAFIVICCLLRWSRDQRAVLIMTSQITGVKSVPTTFNCHKIDIQRSLIPDQRPTLQRFNYILTNIINQQEIRITKIFINANLLIDIYIFYTGVVIKDVWSIINDLIFFVYFIIFLISENLGLKIF